jgi:hypothetical protein
MIGKLVQSIRETGFAATAVRIGEGLEWRTRDIRGWPLQMLRRIRMVADRRFDREYGTNTTGYVGVPKLGLSKEQEVAGIHYEPTPTPASRQLLAAVPVRHEEFTFIDYGSGKGRVLLLASEYPYRRIIGVEASRELHDVALANFRVWKSPRQRCFDLQSVCMDARQFPLPSGPLVLFFFTPFLSPISDDVVERIRQSALAEPRPMRIVYYGSRHEFRDVLARLGFSCSVIYSTRPFSSPRRYTGYLYSNGI